MHAGKGKYTQVDISLWTFGKVAIFVLALWFLYVIRDIVAILFFAVVLASAISPAVDWFQIKKVPRIVGILLIYLALLGVIVLVLSLLIPAIINQSQELFANFPSYIDSLTSGFQSVKYYTNRYGLVEDVELTLQSVTQFLTRGRGEDVFSLLSNIVGGVVSFLIILVITFYMVIQDTSLKKTFRFLAPPRYQPYLTQLFHRIQKKIGWWLRGQLILSCIIGFLCYIGLLVLQVPYALVLALIAGLFEFVPYAGPVLAAIPAIIIGFTVSPLLALFVLVLYIVIQQVENNILVPKVMQKVIGLNPLISISALLIGATVGGVLGAILAIPVATALSVVVSDFFQRREDEYFEDVTSTDEL